MSFLMYSTIGVRVHRLLIVLGGRVVIPNSSMENVKTALSLCFIAQRNLVLMTNNTDSCVSQLREILTNQYSINSMAEIDLLRCKDDLYRQVTDQMVISEEGSIPRLQEVVIWRHLESMKLDFTSKSSIVRIFNELEHYNTLHSRDRKAGEPFRFGNYMVCKPELFVVVVVMKTAHKLPELHRQIKERFWFAQYCDLLKHSQDNGEAKDLRSAVMEGRNTLARVFARPQLEEYICSLLVFTRCHRLCSLAPMSTRPTFRALDGIMQLAKALVVLQAALDAQLYVTPEYVKVAFRKIGYWLVDWETNVLFRDTSVESEYRKRMELTILTGDWYGSEWPSAEEYMAEFASCSDKSSTTGFSNVIVEDVLESVRPPI